MRARRVAVIGGGWAGLAAAIAATQAGQQVTLFEASRSWGGRARTLPAMAGQPARLDNGQHILIGAYHQSLALMRLVGLEPERLLLRQPLRMVTPQGQGLRLPNWPVPLDVLAGIATARGWTWADKWSLLRRTAAWQVAGFCCAPETSVAALCVGISATVMDTLMEPLCVSALNTPSHRASGQVFLRVLRDSLLGGRGSSHLLLPRTDLSALFPDAAARWLGQHGARLCRGERVLQIQHDRHWLVQQQPFDRIILATPAGVASQLLQACAMPPDAAAGVQAWCAQADALQYESIATVYVQAGRARLPEAMLALPSNAQAPAQFVFDRGWLGGPPGLLAFVVSASTTERALLQSQVLQQAHCQLADVLMGHQLQALQTVVEKRATFACTPGLQRPGQAIAPGLLACGDYVDGPYPATLEGAVRSGLAAGQALA